MILPEVVFFPHDLLPLRIFEPRYRLMLERALETHRMFAVVRARETHGRTGPCRTGTLGLIRACVRNADGTSNLILQGLCRVRLAALIPRGPCPAARLVPLAPGGGGRTAGDDALADRIIEAACRRGAAAFPRADMDGFLRDLCDYHALVDVVAGHFLKCPERRQQILEAGDARFRLRLLAEALAEEFPAAARGDA